jgi:hypothetical protein
LAAQSAEKPAGFLAEARLVGAVGAGVSLWAAAGGLAVGTGLAT